MLETNKTSKLEKKSTLLEIEPEENTYASVVIDLTHQCNMSCANCYIPNRDVPDVSKDKIYSFLKRLKGRCYIRLIGAEPTMREDICEIIQMVIKLGHKPSLTTNGIKLSNLKFCQELKAAGLKMVLHSMNGADCDKAYMALDNGRWAKLKVKALENIIKTGFTVNTGTIIAKSLNEYCIKRQVEVFVNTARNLGVNFDIMNPWKRITPVLRIKSVGQIGRNMGGDFSYTLNELAEQVGVQLGVPIRTIMSQPVASGTNLALYQNNKGYKNRFKFNEDKVTSVMFPYETPVGIILIRLIDWSVNDEGVVDGGNPNRGRMTENFKIAPFFEHVKANEYGY